eukprot:3247818-Rhodomonas_salina.1
MAVGSMSPVILLFAFVLDARAWAFSGGLGSSLSHSPLGARSSSFCSPFQRLVIPQLSLRRGENVLDGATSLAMAKKKDDGPPKKQKGPRRRSQRLNNRAEFRNTGPVGAAKRKIMYVSSSSPPAFRLHFHPCRHAPCPHPT